MARSKISVYIKPAQKEENGSQKDSAAFLGLGPKKPQKPGDNSIDGKKPKPKNEDVKEKSKEEPAMQNDQAAAKNDMRAKLEQLLLPIANYGLQDAEGGGEFKESGQIESKESLSSPDSLSSQSQGLPAQPQHSQSSDAQEALSVNLNSQPNYDPLRVLEAALFMSPSGVTAFELGKLLGIGAVGHVSKLLNQLSDYYEKSGSSLEVVEDTPSKWVMRVRSHFAPFVQKFAGEAEISRHALRTLAYISRHEGITKRELFRRLGSGIYQDVAELEEKGFIIAKPAGRTKSVSTTQKFRQYFQGPGQTQ
jgi:segregation and condensation protein B